MGTLLFQLHTNGKYRFQRNRSSTENIGASGNFCPAGNGLNGTTECYAATFGVWKYCLEVPLVELDNEIFPVCFEWNEDVRVEFPDGRFSTGDGLTRWSGTDITTRRQFTAWLLIGSIALICIGDAFSEKLYLCAIVNLLVRLPLSIILYARMLLILIIPPNLQSGSVRTVHY